MSFCALSLKIIFITLDHQVHVQVAQAEKSAESDVGHMWGTGKRGKFSRQERLAGPRTALPR